MNFNPKLNSLPSMSEDVRRIVSQIDDSAIIRFDVLTAFTDDTVKWGLVLSINDNPSLHHVKSAYIRQ